MLMSIRHNTIYCLFCQATYLITGFISSENNGELVRIGNGYNEYDFLDGSPCGVKE